MRIGILRLNNSLFEDFLKKNLLQETESDIIKTEKFLLVSKNNQINNFLNGGLHLGNIYELYGTSLSGKSFFINNLLKNNLHKLNKDQKIIFYDTNNSLTTKVKFFNPNNQLINNNSEISPLVHIEIYNFKELIKSLNDLLTKPNEYAFIIIDSLSMIANKFYFDRKKDLDIQAEFSQIINTLAYRFKIGIIYTTNSMKTKEKEIFNFPIPGTSIICKEYFQSLSHNIHMRVDYTLTFYLPYCNTKISSLKNMKYYLKIKGERQVSKETLIELKRGE
jgi:archaellum biogenesis ATPase FlaH